MPLFDAYLIVDWSANNSPKWGRDSIWIAIADLTGVRWVENLPTRHQAMQRVRDVIEDILSTGKRLFTGFDFAFGYPAGAARIIGGANDWRSVWARLEALITDDAENRSNAFEVAGGLNAKFAVSKDVKPFWGHPHQHAGCYENLAPRKDKSAFRSVSEFRQVESNAKGAKSLWQLCYNGAVGKQSLLGIAHLERLRQDPALSGRLSVWPFESRFAGDLSKPVLISEIYPSLFSPTAKEGEILDAAQVRTLAGHFSVLDGRDALTPLLAAPELASDDLAAVLREEGWIVGAQAGDRR
jgi:precorrin-8X/cobalt-precorrin-8 methylmutase